MFQARFALAAVLGAALTAQGADLTKGTPDIKSAGPLAFGPDGLLFVGDTQGGGDLRHRHRRPHGRLGRRADQGRGDQREGRRACSGPTPARS